MLRLQSETQHEEGEESYFVSMTDIMVGMLFVFIILLMYFVFQIQNTREPMVPLSEHLKIVAERDEAQVKLDVATRRIEDLSGELERLKRATLEEYLTAADRDRTSILEALQESMKKAGIAVRIFPDQGVLRLPEALLFARGKSSIDAGSKAEGAVRTLSQSLIKVLPCFSLGPESRVNRTCNPNGSFVDAIFIEGHTDNVPIKGALEDGITDNLTLSARRATNTVAAVYGQEQRLNRFFSISSDQEGQPLGQGGSPLINAAAFGDTRPAFPNETAEGRSGNRRIDLRLLMYSPRTEGVDAVRKLLDR